MRWSMFLVWAYGLAIAERMARVSPLALGEAAYTPAFTLVLLVFIALLAPGLAVMWAAFVLGMLADLSHALPGDQQTVLGPHVLGYMLGAYAVMQLRTVMVREAATTVAVSTLVSGLLIAVVTVTWLGLRKLVYGDMGGFRGAPWLMASLVEAVYSALIALPMGFALMLMARWFGFSVRSSRKP